MSDEINIIKPALLILFNKGNTEPEAYEEISKSHSSYSVSLKLVSFWFKKFRSGDDSLGDKKKRGPKPKFTDEFLINLVNNNPELKIAELAKIVNVSSDTIAKRLKKINIDGERAVYKCKSYLRGNKKLTDEFLINLVNNNPNLNKAEIAKLVKRSHTAISNRINKINDRVPSEDKLLFPNHKDKLRKSINLISDEYIIKLVNENPKLSIEQLAKLADSSGSVISNRIKKINSDGVKVNYISKKSKAGTKNLTQESIIKLIKENPDLNSDELAMLANTSISTLSLRLKQINKNLPADQKITLKTVTGKRNNSKNIITREEVITLVNENPGLSIKELAKLSDNSDSTLYLRLRQINKDTKLANYTDKKSFNGTKELTEEFLINLVNENPNLNMSELAKLANTSQSTISRRLKNIDNNGKKLKYKDKR
jgi:DNA-binding Lrp family transcriptional regulator